MKSLRATLFVLLSIAATAEAPSAAQAKAATLDVARPEVQSFIATMHREHGFDRQALARVLRDAAPQPRILEIMDRPAERAIPWFEYRARFLNDERINGGVRIWNEHREALEKVSAASGVAPQYLVAITGVETNYGRITGGYRVLDSLVTLAFDYPRRAEYFQGELAQFLLLAREEGVPPDSIRGSYAGAMGIAQFMPSSYRRYAMDGADDGHRDLWTWNIDVFASVAHYFQEHGWKRGEPVLAEATHASAPDDPARAQAALNDTVASLRERGYQFETSLPADTRAVLVPAQLADRLSWRVGFQNFYTITRYNRSLMYAMAVNDLADAIAARRAQAMNTIAPAVEAAR